MIAKGLITQRANDERLPAQTIERDYVLAHICADIGTAGDSRLVFKGGTLLRLCYFADYRYSADLDFSAVNGLSSAEATALVAAATITCRKRLELPMLEVVQEEGGAPWVNYVGPLGAKARKIKLDISDTELVESHTRINLQPRWPDLPEGAAIDGYTLDEVAAEKVRCIAERVQCRDLYDMHQLLDGGHIDPLEAWHLYLPRRRMTGDVAGSEHRLASGPQHSSGAWSLTAIAGTGSLAITCRARSPRSETSSGATAATSRHFSMRRAPSPGNGGRFPSDAVRLLAGCSLAQ